jgi:hypothetical protein
MSELPIRWQKKITVTPDGCWEWFGSISVRGYGQVRHDGRTRSTHRVMYEILVGPIPEGLHLDHLCKYTRCCNPAHLEPVTQLVNAQRTEQATKTHCLRGHPLSGENLVINSAGRRVCVTCKSAAQKRYAEKKRAA